MVMNHPLLGPIKKILARRPAPNLGDGLTMSTHLGRPDYQLALKQYENYLQALRDIGMEVKVLDFDPRFPDGHFVEDPFIIFHDMAFLCRSGALSRRYEGESILPHLDNLRIMRMNDDDAFMDGGDVLICADRVLVGMSERTNRAGAENLHRALKTVKPDIRLDCVEFSGLLHLKSGITEVAPNVIVHDPAFKTNYPFDWAELVTLPPEEGYAADLMPINDSIFIVKGFPTVKKVAQKHSQKVIELDMSEFRKMDGGLTCLSLRY
jgi:dimethylargininase